MKQIIFINLFILFIYVNINGQDFSEVHFKPIFFDQWSTNISNKNDLDYNIKLAKKLLAQHPVYKIALVGKASATLEKRNFMDNLILSLSRANELKEILMLKGKIDDNRIRLIAIGDQEVTVDPKLGVALQKYDRRVDVFVTI